MAKPFTLSPRQARQQKRDLAKKDLIVFEAQKQITALLKNAINEVYASYKSTGAYKPPNLDKMFAIGEQFYKRILIAAFESCEAQKSVKRLAALPAGQLPNGPAALDQVLKHRKYFQKIMARNKALIGRAQVQYLKRLEVQFRRVLPLLESTDLSPKQAKEKLVEAWAAKPGRSEVIFRTEATRYFAKSQVAYYQDSEDILGFLFDSVRDTSRTSWCQSRHGLIYRSGSELLSKNTPPCHWNCRSHLIPLVNDAENRKMLADPKRDPNKVKVIPLPHGWKS